MDRNREIQEAIQAGEYALSCLRDARSELNSAGNWGLLDLFGGGMISGMMKHARIDDAKRSMRRAQQALNSFRKELQDVDNMSLGGDIDGFMTFADFFFDGFLVDMLVQSKIARAKEQVDDAIRRVEDMVYTLRRYQ
ncbi:MAG: hypothetical protein J6N77_00355 [Lachnospiraceae bacterium]|nr:hypothetical protein [Lachnospiraceae bacterium]